jgi:hypothetical protein
MRSNVYGRACPHRSKRAWNFRFAIADLRFEEEARHSKVFSIENRKSKIKNYK